MLILPTLTPTFLAQVIDKTGAVEQRLFYQFLRLGNHLLDYSGYRFLNRSMRLEPFITFHMILSFDYVTCVWSNMYMWYAGMSVEYFVSCFYELPLLWTIFVSILLPDWFPLLFDFYDIPGVENRFIVYHPDKLIKNR